MQRSIETLQAGGALDESGKLTMRGHTSVALPIDFRFASSAIHLLEQGVGHEATCVQKLLALGAACGAYRNLWQKELSEAAKLNLEALSLEDDADFLLLLFCHERQQTGSVHLWSPREGA